MVELRNVAALLLAAALFGGCVRVHPWERETLAQGTMQAKSDGAEERLDGHVEEYREGSIGGSSVGGGGCGCN